MKSYEFNFVHGCTDKIMYNSLRDAKNAIEKMHNQGNKPQYVYYCQNCGGYHLTTKRQRSKRMVKAERRVAMKKN